jgi:hypothetical protein
MVRLVIALALVACSSSKQAVTLDDIRDHMCACHDAACADKVDAELAAWMSKDETKLDDADTKRVAEIGACAAKVRAP